MKNDSIIFDLDGTLWDATYATAKGWNEALEVLGIAKKITAEDIRGVTGQPQEVCIERLLPGLAEKYRNLYDLLGSYEAKAIKEQGGKLYPGVLATISTLASKYPLFIVSNCEEWYLDLFFKKYDVRRYFRDTDCFGRSNKPKSEMIKALINEFHLKNPLYVGDTSSDQKAAQDAGIAFIFSAYGFGKVEAPQVSISTFEELIKLV